MPFEFGHKIIVYVQFRINVSFPQIFTNLQLARVYFFYKMHFTGIFQVRFIVRPNFMMFISILIEQGCFFISFAMVLHSWGKFVDVSVPHSPFEKTPDGFANALLVIYTIEINPDFFATQSLFQINIFCHWL